MLSDMSDEKSQGNVPNNASGTRKTDSGGKKSTSCQAKQKVLKSPVKHEAEDLIPVEQSVSYCPCNNYLEEELSIECESCKKYWHLCCVGLQGLSDEMVGALENWQCPDCYKCVYSYKKRPELNAECSTMRVILKDELHSIQPVIKVTVENAIRKLIPKSICSADDVKSYAEVTKEHQRRVIEEAALAKSSKDVVESVVRQLDSDKIEREEKETQCGCP